MKYVKLIGMALIGLLIVCVVPSLSAPTELKHGTVSSVTGFGTTDSKTEYTAAADSVVTDIMAAAYTSGIGTANIDITVPVQTAQSSTTKNAVVNAEGEVIASVSGTTDTTNVASLAAIHTKADATTGAICGESYILSKIGKTYTAGTISDSATGTFTASSYATGSAEYSTTDTNNVGGNVAGTTTLEADVTNGVVSGTAQLKSSSSIGTDLAAENENIVKVSGEITSSAASKSATIAGTAVGATSSNADTSTNEVRATSGVANEDILSADLVLLQYGDKATAASILNPKATFTATGSKYEATNTISSTASLSRISNGNGVAHSEAFITNGDWNADATNFVADASARDATVSGSLGDIEGAAGIGAGTFLQNKKTGPAVAEVSLDQDASIAGTVGTTSSESIAHILGPKATGAAILDAAGVYGAFKDINMQALTDGTTDTGVLSTDMNVNAYLWVDGGNSALWQGYGFSTDVLFDPTGQTLGPWVVYINSPTQRGTTYTFKTGQPDVST